MLISVPPRRPAIGVARAGLACEFPGAKFAAEKEFSRPMNHLPSPVKPSRGDWRRNVLRGRKRGISIPERLAGLGRQGFQEVSVTFGAEKRSRQGLNVGGLVLLP